jgi:uncharacterized protein YrzB (UPF0473 family)
MSDMEKEVEQVEDDEMEEVDLITLSDEDNNEYEFEVLDEIDYKDGHYYALMPTFDLPDQDIESGSTYMIFEAVEDENGDPQLAEVEDEDLLDEIAEIFENNFDAAEEE